MRLSGADSSAAAAAADDLDLDLDLVRVGGFTSAPAEAVDAAPAAASASSDSAVWFKRLTIGVNCNSHKTHKTRHQNSERLETEQSSAVGGMRHTQAIRSVSACAAAILLSDTRQSEPTDAAAPPLPAEPVAVREMVGG